MSDVDAADLVFLSISEASELVSSRQLSPVEIIDAHLRRIEATDGELNSFITLLAEESKGAAQAAEREIASRGHRGPLHGLPIGLKDLYYTKGIRTTIGSKIMGEFVPDFDAAVTERFRAAGAIVIGKLQMHEFALGATSENPHYGPAHNPWNTGRMTGGSSGGSGSAVAAGQCMGALGSDTGGSVRIPASLCGIVGLKPTFGRVSRYGVYPLSWSFDTVGPMTRTVRDAGLVLNAIAGHDSRDPSSARRPEEDFVEGIDEGVDGLRVGIPREYFFDRVDPEVAGSVRDAAAVLEGLGASVDEVSIPALEHTIPISTPISQAEAAQVHEEHLRERADDIDVNVRNRLLQGALMSATDYIKAHRARAVYNAQMAEAFERSDFLIAPTCPMGAPRLGESTIRMGGVAESTLALLSRLTRPFNICGSPTVSVPCGFTADGTPIGVQIAGRPFEDAAVLRVAHAYEQATEWHKRRPPI